MTRRSYDVDTPEQRDPRLALIAFLVALILALLGAFVGVAWYFWGEFGAQVAFLFLCAVFLILLSWAIIMASINRVSFIYRDATDLIVNFQAADDRGEVMRSLANVVKSGNQLDSSVLRLAGNMAKGQARAIVDSERRLLTTTQPEAPKMDLWNMDSDSVENFPGWQ
jgi:hypothetical protein